MQIVVAKKTMTAPVVRTTMVPSSSSSTSLNVHHSRSHGIATTSRLFSSASASIEASDENGDVLSSMSTTSAAAASTTTTFQRHPNDSNLFLIPPDLHPIYRPLPLLVRLGVWLAASAASAGWTCLRHSVEQSCSSRSSIANKTRFIVGYLLRTVLMGLLASTLLQERLRPPTRITTFELKKRYTLPSVLSRFESIPVPFLRSTIPRRASSLVADSISASDQSTTPTTEELGIHYLRYDRDTSSSASDSKTQQSAQFQAIYANHGFGASSLSWLPVLPRMVDRLRARVGVGHDAVGFGFTDRPKGNIPWKSHAIESKDDDDNDTEETQIVKPTLSQRLAPYSTQASSAIGTTLLQHVLTQPSVDKNTEVASDKGADEEDEEKPVILMGHSMGALATLKMALAMPSTTRKWIILVAPALGMKSSTSGDSSSISSSESDSSRSLIGTIKEVSIHGASIIGRYTLRRVVGRKGFWRKGLEAVWGDSKKLSDSDVLRFQWPAIGRGWEDGLLTFTRAMAQKPALSDAQLIEQVLQEDTNATITVILGSNDRVVSTKQVKKFFDPHCHKIRLVEMEGLGHDPFEEDAEGFVRVVEQILEEEKSQILGKPI